MDVQCYEITISVPHKQLADPFRRTLRWLKRAEPEVFRKINRNLKRIVVLDRRGYYNETDVRKRRWTLTSSFLSRPADIPYYLASLLLHEAEHVAQFRSGKPYRGPRAETQAYRIQREFLDRFDQEQAIHWLDKQLRSRWWQKMDDKHP